MHALCTNLLIGKGNCKGRRTDVIHNEERPIMYRIRTRRRSLEDDDEELRQHHSRKWFYVLEIGDPSRDVIERIFRATATDTTRSSINIEQVLKLNNSRETLERFESFRECVKNKANNYEHCFKNPRNMVDGNEQLLFYGTKFTYCKRFRTSKICKDSDCSICNIIKSGFYTAKKKTGMWLTTSCQDFINANADANAETMNVKMAVIVCRVITGRVIDLLNSNYEGDFDSIGGVNSNQLFVKNPCAVLPCFIITLNCRYFC
uniref:uncharacterized protein LOC122599314 n=1 Tax=Erigeron canadensis TaxID=72917 RepID=UPI001CB8EAF4|nr:uncharacterized protein LOC122599314 [Erigeron canadensis]